MRKNFILIKKYNLLNKFVYSKQSMKIIKDILNSNFFFLKYKFSNKNTLIVFYNLFKKEKNLL